MSAPGQTGTAVHEAGPGAGATVLVVDDNPLNIELVKFVLEADGLPVEAVPDGATALSLIRARPPSLILMDIQLPGIDGLSLTRRLKGDPSTRQITIIAFTAYAMTGDEARMLDAGCDGYIAKPIDVSSFARTVRTFLAATPAA